MDNNETQDKKSVACVSLITSLINYLPSLYEVNFKEGQPDLLENHESIIKSVPTILRDYLDKTDKYNEQLTRVKVEIAET